MDLFQRLKTDAAAEWQAYVAHDFVQGMEAGTLPEASFRHYLFLIQFARAYALAIYKSPAPDDMRQALEGVKAILDTELGLHIELCGSWGMSREEVENAPEATQTMAYTRFVLEAGMAGDLLDLQVALAPCILGYAEIGAAISGGALKGNPYKRWIDEYSSAFYQGIAADFRNWMEKTAGIYMTRGPVSAVIVALQQGNTAGGGFLADGPGCVWRLTER